MKDALHKFIEGSLFEASTSLLQHLNVYLDRETAEAINVAELFDGEMPQYLTNALSLIDHTYYIGVVNNETLSGRKKGANLNELIKESGSEGKYDGLFVFACDAKQGVKISRTSAASLTRAFNRIAYANPVVLIIRQEHLLSLSTCERQDFNQIWRRSSGEKLGRVSILRNIDCVSPHRGHLDILSTLGDRSYSSFDSLYDHWMEVFSSELLTKRFYNELSDWYAWALNVVSFPNNIQCHSDSTFNQENTIRLITRLIFVWFLKQKQLVPDQLFDRQFISQNLIKGFNPDVDNDADSGYKSSDSTYYKAILQNLFFAMLNRPLIQGEGRRDFNVGGLLYKDKLDNPSLFLELANQRIPFLNSGLFDCLDYPDQGLFYDGFTEDEEIQEKLVIPDYLFFGKTAGCDVDLSSWYDDQRKRHVSVRGIINILESYNFTIEENTPFDQEISLDPELLGKIFENLLAAYNPETKETARKQTGSFYTPGKIVHYLAESSIYLALCNKCEGISPPLLRDIVSYNESPLTIDYLVKEQIVRELYKLKIIDPACGSGAFPLSVLQQMVHILSRLDPNNEIWKKVMLEEAQRGSLNALLDNDRKARQQKLLDIEDDFNDSITNPDYARKLYIIKNCLYGVDIQPIAVQITQLRFFISLIVDQKGSSCASENFGIKPLPNIETKFVSADSLMPLQGVDARVLDSSCSAERDEYRDCLNNLFLSQYPSDKVDRRGKAIEARKKYVEALAGSDAIGAIARSEVDSWDAYNVNSSSSFYNTELMFGICKFDIVIGNPPYGAALSELQAAEYRSIYDSTVLESAMFFIEHGMSLLCPGGILAFIVPKSLTYASNYKNMRRWLEPHLVSLADCGKAFEKVKLEQCIIINQKDSQTRSYDNYVLKFGEFVYKTNVDKNCASDFGLLLNDVSKEEIEMANRIRCSCSKFLKDISSNTRGEGGLQRQLSAQGPHRVIGGKEIDRSGIRNTKGFISQSLQGKGTIKQNALLFQNVVAHIMNPFPHVKLIGCIPNDSGCYITDTINQIELCPEYDRRVMWAILNSKLISWYVYSFIYGKAIRTMHFDAVATDRIPLIFPPNENVVIEIVDELLTDGISSERWDYLSNYLDLLIYKTYSVSYKETKLVDPCLSITQKEYDEITFE